MELLVDSNHFLHIKNRINKYSGYCVEDTFDPLSVGSFDWEGEGTPESQESVLRQNFVCRLGASVKSSSLSSTREHIMRWAMNRGMGRQLECQLIKQGTVVPICHDEVAGTAPSTTARDRRTTVTTESDSASGSNTNPSISRKRRHSASECVEKYSGLCSIHLLAIVIELLLIMN
jgi:hypothetical protein